MLKFIFSYMKEHKWVYLLIVVVLVVYDMTMLIPTQVIQRLVDNLSRQTLTQEIFIRDLLILVGATLLNYGTAALWSLKLFQSSIRFKFGIQQRAFKKLVNMRTPFYEKFRSGDMMTRFSTDVESLMELVGYGFMVLVYAGGMIAFILPTMLLISWKITLLAMIPMGIQMVLMFFASRKQEEIVDENREAVANLSNEVLEAVEGIRVMRAYSKREKQESRFEKRTHALAREGDRIAMYQSLYSPLISFLLGVSVVLIFLVGQSEISSGSLSLGQLLALQLYLFSLVEPSWMLADLVLIYQTGQTAFSKVQELIETGDDMETDGSLEVGEIEDFTFSHYHFTYPQAERESLVDINWTLKAGQTVGIVGKTGSGKTSLIRQFLRQYPLGQGDFSLNGQSVADYAIKDLESRIGYVPQEHILFSKSVRENIALGKIGASEAEIIKAIETAAFSQDVEKMSDGLDTMIGERGVSISGGQKQRISIARAFLRQPEVLILDDSLSAVDARTERQIIENIQKERRGKTNLIVSHRLSAVHQADWILVLDEGRIVEEGRAEDLLAAKGWYYEQYQRQESQKGE